MLSGLGIDIEMGAIRCYEIPEDGEAIEPETMLVLAAEQHADMMAGWRAVECCDMEGYNLATWIPAGPESGSLGGLWTVSILLD